MNKVFNFCAGPAMLPPAVLQRAQSEMIDWQGLGVSVMEVSHRDKPFMAVAAKAEADLRELMAIPDNYKVLFLAGGGRSQFTAVPLNLLKEGEQADYLITGQWSKAAFEEAKRFRDVAIAAEIDMSTKPIALPVDIKVRAGAKYLHYCPNETVDGIEMFEEPAVDVPLVADMSSCILSRRIDVSKYGLIYAGAQKNIGPSGLAVVIVRSDLLRDDMQVPCIWDYAQQAQQGSMVNTPPTYAWYLAGLVFEWLKEVGGVAAMEAHNAAKAELLYGAIDSLPLYQNLVDASCRSRMNVVWQLKDESLNEAFLAEAEALGLLALKGHRFVGGMRASMYNAMPLAGTQALVAFMQDFAARHG
ncbi:3-phosphoserine/phosphohydroxythreonine transaminase [Gallaecimonas xiamenensis]|uniref:Phosphoserine aminotransferase n=1 Tax=Gallaecimonas xiamenensis 3-C-1 TaxID=745411 RepID=K2K1M0_9GAMM|nr:3-phosphoserine/phosphohydroxythreonine transaminase [Gallaecimonas xiamenensis]EKE76679.1 3-phosphoserine/phosphohydroxythreonine aminotransferase [Gallaecimonas xiamenensis 3-C-1]